MLGTVMLQQCKNGDGMPKLKQDLFTPKAPVFVAALSPDHLSTT